MIKDIRTWIFVVFLFQLIFIGRPPLEPAHAWRQSLTNMMARNFVQEDASFLLPQIDIAGEHSGVIASELPVLQYIMSGYYRIFGFSHWIGRLINLIISFLGIYCFTKTIELVTQNKTFALFCGVFLIFSNWFSFTVKSMPDTFSVALAMIALYGLCIYLFRNKLAGILIFMIIGALSMLSKIPAALYLSPSVLFLIDKRVNNIQKSTLLISGVLALIPVIYWYGYKVPQLVETHKFELFFPRDLRSGLREIWTFRSDATDKLLNKGFSSYILSVLSFTGFLFAMISGSLKARLLALCVIPVFAFYAIKTGLVWATHSYYMIPLVPFMAVSIAYLAVKYQNKRWLTVILIIGAIECVGSQWNDYFIRDNKKYLINIEDECDQFSNRTYKVVCNGTPNPQFMYFINRRGWSLDTRELTAPETIENIIRFQPKWLILDRNRPDCDLIAEKWKSYTTPVYRSDNLLAFRIN